MPPPSNPQKVIPVTQNVPPKGPPKDPPPPDLVNAARKAIENINNKNMLPMPKFEDSENNRPGLYGPGRFGPGRFGGRKTKSRKSKKTAKKRKYNKSRKYIKRRQ